MKSAEIRLVGLAGTSCSGKTTLSIELEKQLGEIATRLSFDDYYIPRSQRPNPTAPEEGPDMYDIGRFVQDLKLLKSGKSITIPANSRESGEQGITRRTIQPKPIILVDGYLIFHDPQAREAFDHKVFIEIPEDEIVLRRQKRRHPTNPIRHDTDEYIHTRVIPVNREYVLPQKRFADTVLDGMKPISILTQQVRDEIKL